MFGVNMEKNMVGHGGGVDDGDDSDDDDDDDLAGASREELEVVPYA